MTRAPRAILYLRLSASDDASTSIQRQEADLRALAEREGWIVDAERVLVDDGISGRKVRANADEALRMIREGEAEVLAVWKLDRWTRQGLAAVGDLVATLDASPGSTFVALNDGLRSDQAAWRIIASVLAEVARMEADNTALRVRSTIRSNKRLGRWTGGQPPLGYRPAPSPDGAGRVLVLDDVEAATIREAAERYLAGNSLSSITRDLNVRGFPLARSPYRLAVLQGKDPEGLDRGEWPVSTLKSVLLSDSIMGRVKVDGRVLRDENGAAVTVWPPILDATTHARLHERLIRTPGTAPRRRAARLLSGLVFCGTCGSKMHVTTGSRRPVYRCSAPSAGIVCPVTTVGADSVDEIVSSTYLRIVGEFPEIEDVEEVTSPETIDEIASVEATLRDLSARLTEDDADTATLVAQIGALKARRAILRETPSSITVTPTPTGRTLAEAWESSFDLDRRRRLLLSAMDHVRIHPAPADRKNSGRSGVDPRRVEIMWNS